MEHGFDQDSIRMEVVHKDIKPANGKSSRSLSNRSQMLITRQSSWRSRIMIQMLLFLLIQLLNLETGGWLNERGHKILIIPNDIKAEELLTTWHP
jgi:hypothetical protein